MKLTVDVWNIVVSCVRMLELVKQYTGVRLQACTYDIWGQDRKILYSGHEEEA